MRAVLALVLALWSTAPPLEVTYLRKMPVLDSTGIQDWVQVPVTYVVLR